MKKKILFIIGIFLSVITLSSCVNTSSGVITKISEEVEYTKIENNITEVYEKVSKGCVGLVVSNSATSASGSGVIYKKLGNIYYVVTNAHVVKDMKTCKIFFGGTTYNSATIVGYDTKNDIGVVTFTLDLFNTDLEDKIYINDIFNYEDNDLLAIGQTVLAIGCPLGTENFNILTTGVVSSVDKYQISTDAAINPGNSGGGLFNMAGRLVGINTEKEVWTTTTGDDGQYEDIPVEGRGFAIPLEIVKNCINQIEKKGGVVERPILGVQAEIVNTVLNPNSKYEIYLPKGRVVCVVVSEYSENSAAKKAGVLIHDVIIEINGKPVEGRNDITNELNSLTMDDTVLLKVYRLVNYQPTTVEITVTFQ